MTANWFWEIFIFFMLVKMLPFTFIILIFQKVLEEITTFIENLAFSFFLPKFGFFWFFFLLFFLFIFFLFWWVYIDIHNFVLYFFGIFLFWFSRVWGRHVLLTTKCWTQSHRVKLIILFLNIWVVQIPYSYFSCIIAISIPFIQGLTHLLPLY